MSEAKASERELIASTVTSVAHFIDQKQWSELRGLYAARVRTDYTSLFGGEPQEQPADALIAAWRQLLTPITTQHLLGPVTIELAGGKATARCHVRAYHHVKGAAGGDEWLVAGHYVFELGTEGAVWKIVGMTLQAFYQSGNLKLLEVAGGK